MSLKLAPTALAVFLSTLIVTFVFVGINIKAFGLAITFGSLLMIGVRSLQNNYYIPDDRILNPEIYLEAFMGCLLYTSPSPRDAHESRMPSSA